MITAYYENRSAALDTLQVRPHWHLVQMSVPKELRALALGTISFSTDEGHVLLGHCCAWGQGTARWE